METTRDDYAVIIAEGGVPAEVAHRLRPQEARLLAYVIQHRERAVSPQELAREAIGGEIHAVRKELERTLFMVAITVARHGRMRTVGTHSRGEFGFGVQWESSQRAVENEPNEQKRRKRRR
jgi:hypothetical protein